jgi:uncharacterized protein YfaP (DUF2135 family)
MSRLHGRGARGVLLALLLGLAVPARAKRHAPAPCGGGVFSPAGPVAVTVLFTGTQVAIDAICTTPVTARVRARRKLTVITAKWPSCTGLTGPVTLTARLRAPACTRMTGVITARKSRPRRRHFRADRLRPSGLVARLADVDTQKRMINENFPVLIRPAAEAYNPEIVALIAGGSASVDAILDQFRRPAGVLDETPLSLLAYALERIGDPRAVPVLTDWLEQNLFGELVWATDFVTHTIKVLARLGGLNTATYLYGIEEKLDTIAQARLAAAVAAVHPAIRPAAQGDEFAGVCQETILVTGIDANGQQKTIPLSYEVARRDYQDVITQSVDPAQVTSVTQMRNNVISADEDVYGGSDYVPVAGPEILLKSICGGTVAEHLLNAVAQQKGLPVRIPVGRTDADAIRDLARAFGSSVFQSQIDPFTVIAHEVGDSAKHVEVPVQVGDGSVIVYSKDEFGRLRQHTVSTNPLSLGDPFEAPHRHYDQRPWYAPSDVSTSFYRIDPNRIVSIVVDSSACPCNQGAPETIPVAFTAPTDTMTDQRVVTVAGTVGDPSVTSGTLRVNGLPQSVDVSNGAFSAQVVLRSGDNVLQIGVDAPDGRRGCSELRLTSSTLRTTISATLTWNLGNADVDLYVTQPDDETAWYSHKVTAIGGRLDVDNTQGKGPENYFLSAAAGNTVLPGPYTIRVHYYSDHQRTMDTPTRIVAWRVVILVNEGAGPPTEMQEIAEGSLSADNSGNSAPGSDGSDWGFAATITIANGQAQEASLQSAP